MAFSTIFQQFIRIVSTVIYFIAHFPFWNAAIICSASHPRWRALLLSYIKQIQRLFPRANAFIIHK